MFVPFVGLDSKCRSQAYHSKLTLDANIGTAICFSLCYKINIESETIFNVNIYIYIYIYNIYIYIYIYIYMYMYIYIQCVYMNHHLKQTISVFLNSHKCSV